MAVVSFTPFPELFTKNLYLRQLSTDDAQEIFLLRSDPIVNKYLGRPKATHIDEARAFIDMINSSIKNDKSVFWAICLKDNTGLLGTICLWNFSPEKHRAEIGYTLLPEFHGKGIMQEAFPAILDFGFNRIQLQAIDAWTTSQNLNSIKILERNHFIRDLKLESGIDRSVDGEDMVIFSLSKSQFSLPPSSS